MMTRDEWEATAPALPPHDPEFGLIRSRYRGQTARRLGRWGFVLLWPTGALAFLDAVSTLAAGSVITAFNLYLTGFTAAGGALSLLCYLLAARVDIRAIASTQPPARPRQLLTPVPVITSAPPLEITAARIVEAPPVPDREVDIEAIMAEIRRVYPTQGQHAQ